MRRLLAAVLVAAVGVVTGTSAWAARIQGTVGSDRLVGTKRADVISGLGGNDRLEGRGGSDLLHGGAGRDRIVGGPGADRVAVHYDDSADAVECGAGRDVVMAEHRDRVASDCEVVSRQLSRDRSFAEEAQHETQVEPDSFAFGQTIVATFQTGRFVDGGAANIGWATSRNAGRTWRSGFFPGLSVYSTPAGRYDAVSDPVVAYDALHGTWLAASLAIAEESTAILVSRSTDGVAWGLPVVVAADAAEDYDKEWIVCDNWPASPFRGRCYVSYLDAESGQIRTRRSTDGGLRWSAPAGVPGRTDVGVANGAQPVVRPNGLLVMPFTVFAAFERFDDPNASYIAAVTSTDGGLTFSDRMRIAEFQEEPVIGVRAAVLTSAEVDGAGTIYLAWHDCSFRPGCLANDIVIARSTDGIRWTRPSRVQTGLVGGDVHYFIPGLAVDPSTSGRRARVAIAYHVKAQDCGLVRCPGVDVALVSSSDGGSTWGAPQRLTVESMPLEWIADSGVGRMLGDYISTSFVGGRPIAVFALASQRVLGEFRQAIFATTRVAPEPRG